jgi:hypothetical protein
VTLGSALHRHELFKETRVLSFERRLAMNEAHHSRKNRQYRWSQEARELVRTYASTERPAAGRATGDLKVLLGRLVAVTGHPRRACWYFVRQMSMVKLQYRKWTPPEQQRLLDLMALNPLCEVAKIMGRSERSLRSKLHKLGASSQMGHDWFTKYTLAEALHVRADRVQGWLDRGWLKARVVETDGLKKQIIDADQFAEFCKSHRVEVIGRRLNVERLDFIQNFVFPPSHAALLPLRERGYKKRGTERETGNGANRRALAIVPGPADVVREDLREREDEAGNNVA